jgi:beta-lactamase regulating signal transducer with metallopeptidase domain
MAWLQLLALLAVEVGLIALGVALLRRWSPTAAWRRTVCQAGVTAVLVITICELSGSARVLGSWAASALHGQFMGHSQPRPAAASASAAILKQPSESGPAEQAFGSAPDPAPALRPAVQSSETLPERPIASVGQDRIKLPGPRAGLAHSTQEHASLPGEPERSRLVEAAASRDGSRSESVGDSMGILWLGLAWVAGAALTGARACLAHCLFVIFQLRRRPVADRALVERVRALAQALGIKRRVRVIESGRLTSPIAFGLLRPTVGLPPDFTGRYDAASQDAMLAHELAHLTAHDPFWCLLADAATMALWWHPAVWWLRRQLHLASEMAADEASLLVADGPRVLAECLVELGTRLARPALVGQLRVSGFRSHLGRRVQQLMRLEGRAWAPPPRFGAAVMKVFGPMVMTIIVVLCTAWAAPQALTKGDSMKTMKLNWKRSLATLALLAAFNSPEPTTAVAQSDAPEPPAPPAPAAAPAAPAAPADAAANSEAAEAPSAPNPPAPPATPADDSSRRPGLRARGAAATTDAMDAQTQEAFRRRYGLVGGPGVTAPVGSAREAEKTAHGVKTEAKLKQIVLEEVAFDGLPLGEVLKFLSEESTKRDPDKTGVNFLINPNVRSVAPPVVVDPATGLPVAAPAELVDLASIIVKFNLPLRHVTMKDVLDAIVVVADHPIEYKLEDYAVVFSAKAEPVGGQAMIPALLGGMPRPPQAFNPRLNALPMAIEPPRPPAAEAESPGKAHRPKVDLTGVRPQTFNIDFGSSEPTGQVGPAAAGRAGDFWNTVMPADNPGFNDHHTESGLKFAGGDPSPIEAELINLGGCWGSSHGMGVTAPMLDTYNYPTGNQGGNSKLILRYVPAGKYTVYLYGHGINPLYYGDYTLTVGTRNYGRKQTSHKEDAIRNTKWVEGSQYVKFANVKVGEGDELEVLIQPGEQVTDPLGRTLADAMINGLQLVPVR